MAKGFIKSKEEKWIDENGNERIVTTEKEFHYNTQEDAFYMVFVNYIQWTYGVKGVTTIKLLIKLLERAEFNSGEIAIPSGLRKQLIAELKISPSMFTKALKELIETEVLQQRKLEILDSDSKKEEPIKGLYLINPEMFWKGDLKKRKDLIVVFKSGIKDKIDQETGEILET